MAQFCIRIAGHTARVTSLFDSTRDYCGKYLTEDSPQCHITVTREDLAFEQESLRQEALEEGIRIRVFTDPFLERAAIQRKLAEFLFDRDILMTHGSTVAVDGKAYLFTANAVPENPPTPDCGGRFSGSGQPWSTTTSPFCT